jgi:hypothetical protein
MEFQGVRKLKAPSGERAFYLTIGGKTDQKAHFTLKVSTGPDPDAQAPFNPHPGLYVPVMFVRLAKMTGENTWQTIPLEGQATDRRFKRTKEDWYLGPSDSRVVHLAISKKKLEEAYNASPQHSFAFLRVELEGLSAFPGGEYVRQAVQLPFALFKPFEMLSSTMKFEKEVALTDPAYREYWVHLWSKDFKEASDKARELGFTIQSSVADTDANETTTTSQVTQTKGVQSTVEASANVSWTIGNLATLGQQFLASAGLKVSRTGSESVAQQYTQALRTLRSATGTVTVTRQLVFEIPPTAAGKTVNLYIYICPVYQLYRRGRT